LGLASYYRRFVSSFAAAAAPLHALFAKNQRFVWTTECGEAFEKLKEALVTSPVLAMPNDHDSFILDTNACDVSVGAVLSQVQDEMERVIAYASRSPSKQERNYCVTRKQLLAVVYYKRAFQQYLLGRKFLIRTNHSALQWLRSTPEPIGQQARWCEILEEFDFQIVHRPGLNHGNADAMSRRPCRQCGQDPIVKSLHAQRERFSEREGILYRKFSNSSTGEDLWQTVLPVCHREEAMLSAHSSVSGGHMGVKKNQSKI